MALTKITPQMFDTSATTHDFNVDNGVFVVDASANRVGIGTTTPSTLLDVNGNVTVSSTGATELTLSGNFPRLYFVDTSGSDLDAYIVNNANGLFFGKTNSPTSSNDIMMLDLTNQRVGIGTTTPSTLLDVNGALTATTIAGTLTTAAQTNITSVGTLTGLSVSGAATFASTVDAVADVTVSNTSTNSAGVKFATASANRYIESTHDGIINIGTGATLGGGTKYLTINSGNVGIGTSTINADSILHLKSAQPNIYFEDTDDSKSWRLEAGSVFKVQNITTSTEAFRITQNGYFGIGSSNPGKSLVIDSSNGDPGLLIIKKNSGNNVAYIGTGSSGATEYGIMQLMHAGSTDVQLYAEGDSWINGGDLGIGTTNPNARLDVRGTNNTTFASSAAGNPANVFLTGTNAYDSGYAGSGILFAGMYNSSSADTTFAVVSGIKENTTDGQYGGALTFMTRTHGQGAGNRERMRITSTGNVSIGSTHAGFSGWRVFNIRGDSTGGLINFENSSGTRSATFANQGAGIRYQTHISGGYHRFETEGTPNGYPLYIANSGVVSINGTSTSSHQMKITSSTMGLRIKSGTGGYSSLTWSGDGENTIGSLTTHDSRIWIGSQNSSGTGAHGEIVIKPGTSNSSGGVGTTLGRAPDVSLEVGGPLKILNNTAGGVSQTHTNMTVANSGKLLINFASIGTMTSGDTIVFTYNAISWKSWFFKIRWSSTGGYIGELWAGGYNNQSDGAQVINPRYYAAGSGDGSSNTTVEGATLTVTRSGQANTMTLTLNNTHVHPLFEIEYSCGGGEGYPQASRASITVNS